MSVERHCAILGTESSTFSSPGDTPTPHSPATEELDRVKTAADLWCTVIETWGHTLRFALTILVTAIALRAVTGPIPWELVQRMLRQGA